MNDYRVTFERDGRVETRLVTAATAKAAAADLPEDADVLEVRFERARGFSCRARGTTPAGR